MLDSIRRLASILSRRHGGIDVLINNAAVSYASTSDVEEKSIVEVSPYHLNYMGSEKLEKENVCD